ncbi:MAG: hypothetical protein ACJ70M_04470 [Nitrososphaera sp.]
MPFEASTRGSKKAQASNRVTSYIFPALFNVNAEAIAIMNPGV